MKIAYFIGSLNRGGAESLILDICRRSTIAPYDFICVYRHDGNMSSDFFNSGASLIRVPKKYGILRYLYYLRKTFSEEQVTIVHSQTTSNTLLLSIALIGTGIKIITTFHGYNFGKAPWWQRTLVYQKSDKILCVSEHQKQYYEKMWELPITNKLQVVYNGIDFTKIDNVKTKIVNQLESDGVKLVMVGNFVDVRSQMVIVKAIDILRNRGVTNFDFYFVGKRVEKEHELYDNCVKYCEENELKNVHFLGSRGDVPEILKTVDGFVYSTAHDTFGIAVIEATAAGLPIVVNNWPVMSEVCNLGLSDTTRAIRFFRTNDVDDCAQKMEELLKDIKSNQKVLREQCQQAADAAKKKYAIQNHINQLNTIYQSL